MMENLRSPTSLVKLMMVLRNITLDLRLVIAPVGQITFVLRSMTLDLFRRSLPFLLILPLALIRPRQLRFGIECESGRCGPDKIYPGLMHHTLSLSTRGTGKGSCRYCTFKNCLSAVNLENSNTVAGGA